MKKYFKKIAFFFYSLNLIILIGCEDDPLLAPQADNDEDCGSYCLMKLSDQSEDNLDKDNPELY